MPLKQFNIYSDSFKINPGSATNLVVEAGKSHVAVLAANAEQNSVDAFELFSFSKQESEQFENVVSYIKGESTIFSGTGATGKLIINDEFSMLIPAYKFNKEIAEDYLQLVFGDYKNASTFYTSINSDPVIMNAFLVEEELVEMLKSLFSVTSIQHAYSSIIQDAMQHKNSTEVLYIQFYHQHLIVCAIKQDKLQIVQSLSYDAPDDVLYYLLNVCRQLQFNSADLSLQVCGLIDVDSKLYMELVKYFENVFTGTVPSITFPSSEQAYPAHYFTPFCKHLL